MVETEETMFVASATPHSLMSDRARRIILLDALTVSVLIRYLNEHKVPFETDVKRDKLIQQIIDRVHFDGLFKEAETELDNLNKIRNIGGRQANTRIKLAEAIRRTMRAGYKSIPLNEYDAPAPASKQQKVTEEEEEAATVVEEEAPKMKDGEYVTYRSSTGDLQFGIKTGEADGLYKVRFVTDIGMKRTSKTSAMFTYMPMWESLGPEKLRNPSTLNVIQKGDIIMRSFNE